MVTQRGPALPKVLLPQSHNRTPHMALPLLRSNLRTAVSEGGTHLHPAHLPYLSSIMVGDLNRKKTVFLEVKFQQSMFCSGTLDGYHAN